MVMLAATRIESRFTVWADIVGVLIVFNNQLNTTNFTNNGFHIKFSLWPNSRRGQQFLRDMKSTDNIFRSIEI